MWKAYTTSGNSLDPELRTALGSACADDSCMTAVRATHSAISNRATITTRIGLSKASGTDAVLNCLVSKERLPPRISRQCVRVSTHKRENSSSNVTGQIALPAMVIRNASETSTLGICLVDGQGNRNRGSLRLAHVPAHVRDAPQKERRRREGCAGVNAARKHLGHSERLRASDHANQARCAEPSCELVARQKRRKTKHRGLSDVNGRTKFWRGFASG